MSLPNSTIFLCCILLYQSNADESAEIPPAVNQVEAHPYFQQEDLKKYLSEKNILLEAYSPLGNNLHNMPRYDITQLVPGLSSAKTK